MANILNDILTILAQNPDFVKQLHYEELEALIVSASEAEKSNKQRRG